MFNFLLEGEATGGGLGGSLGTILMVVAIFVIFYFFMIRPQKKQEKKDNEMRDALAVGDEITTIGGIIGKVVSIKGETFVLETTRDKTKIRFLRGAIRSVDVKAQDIALAVMEGAAEENAEADVNAESTELESTGESQALLTEETTDTELATDADTAEVTAEEESTDSNKGGKKPLPGKNNYPQPKHKKKKK